MIYVEEGEEVYITETVYNKETGKPRRQVTTLNGLKQTPPDGAPSQLAFDKDGTPTHKWWHEADIEHRTDGPSSVILYPENGGHMTEVFEVQGHPRPSAEGPCLIKRRLDGSIWKEEYSKDRKSELFSAKQKLEP